jgi:hypothetical protein|tara:strand:+ start:14927 stop:15175 length:249 start_codon:yes stop_codon:yes gene_type:complete
MSNYYSYGRCTKNEKGLVEVTMEYNNGFWADVFSQIRVKETWVDLHYAWQNKETGDLASTDKSIEISEIIEMMDDARIESYR